MAGQTELKSKLEKLWNEMKDWERKPIAQTSHVIIELIKLPARETKRSIKPSRLALQLRRIDAFRGLIIDDPVLIDEILSILSSEKIKNVAIALKEIMHEKIGTFTI